MKVSFIIPLYNNLPLTQAMLSSLRATVPASLTHEIILVDDGSSDGTREWLAGLAAPCRVLLNERNLGFAATCNRGAAAATGEFLFFLNNDLVLLPGWLEPLLALLADPDTGVAGNVQLSFATGAVDHAGIFFDSKGKPEHRMDRGWPGQSRRRVPAVTGACFGVRRPVWIRLGGFDEGYVNGCEDVDLCLRARAAGLDVCLALRSIVRHHVSASAGRKRRDEQNTRRLFRQWRRALARLISRDSARACLAASWSEPRDYVDSRLARDAFLHLGGLPPTARVLAAAEAKLDLELAHWAETLDRTPFRPRPEVAWQYYPIRPVVRPAV